MPHDRPAPGSAKDWLARAKGDLAIAEAPLPDGAFYEDEAEGDFKTFAGSFNVPNCELLSSGKSVLKTRRPTDGVCRLMNESGQS